MNRYFTGGSGNFTDGPHQAIKNAHVHALGTLVLQANEIRFEYLDQQETPGIT